MLIFIILLDPNQITLLLALRQILLKHIETAPKEILGEFPRLSRDSALTMIMQAQRNLEIKYGITEKKEINENANKNNIPSLFDINIPVPPELMQTENGGCLKILKLSLELIFRSKILCREKRED